MEFTFAHFAGLLLTLLLVAAVGFWAATQVRTTTDFAVGGRSAGASIVAGAIIGSIIGGASTVGTAQLAFTIGLSAWWFTLGAGIALFLLAFGFAIPLRQSGLQTISQFLVANFGTKAGPLTSAASSVGIFFSIVANILSALPLVAAILNIKISLAAIAVFALILLFVFWGGLRGAGLIGLIKIVLIYCTLGAVGWIAYHSLGGISGLHASFPEYPWFSLFGRGLWTDMASGLSLVVGTLSTQTYIQAIYSARDIRTARLGSIIAAVATLPTGIPAILAGLYMRIHHPDIAPIDTLPLFILSYLPPWLGGIAIAALLLAAVGSAAGLALGVGTTLSRDILTKWWNPADEKRSLLANRITVLVVALLATLFTFGNLKSLVLEWNFLSMGLRGAGIFLPLTAAIFFPGRIAAPWAIRAMAAGAAVALSWNFIFPDTIDPLYAGLAACALCLAAGWQKK